MNTVEPIRNINLLDEILEDLEHDDSKHGRRIYLLFTTMLYTGLRVSDIVKLRKENVDKEAFYLTEQKTQKRQRITLPRELRDIYDNRLENLDGKDFLFPSRKSRPDGERKHITTRQAGYDMKIIKRRYNITFPFACHSVRKTFGYMLYKSGVPIEVLRQRFNHSSEIVTRRYIGIDEEEREKYFQKFDMIGYAPPRMDARLHPRKGKTGADLEVNRQDRTENGRRRFEKMQKKAMEKKKHRSNFPPRKI